MTTYSKLLFNLMRRDVNCTYVSETSIAINTPCRLRGIHLVSNSNNGSIICRDGGAQGNIKYQVDTASNNDVEDIEMPLNGVLFETNLHITISGADSVTLLHTDV